MSRFISAGLACERYLASERSLELHARRGNLPFRGEAGARLYDGEVLPLLFLPRGAASALPSGGTLGALRMGARLAALEPARAEELPPRRRRRHASTSPLGNQDVSCEAQEA